jgi:hypothetical protein
VLPPSLGDSAPLFYLKFKLPTQGAVTSSYVLQLHFSTHYSCLDGAVMQEIASLF